MSKPWIAHDDEGALDMDNLSTQRWLDGHVPGAEAASNWLHSEAVTLFQRGDDKNAALLRDVAVRMLKEVTEKLEVNIKRHEREHPYREPGET